MAKQQTGGFVAIPYQFGGKSGIQSDFDVRNIAEGKFPVTGIYTGAVNMRQTGTGLGVTPGYEPVEGNTYLYTPEEVVEQNKIFRVLVDTQFLTVADTPEFTFTLSTPSGAELAAFTDDITFSNLATALTDIETLLTTEFAAFTPVTSVTQTGTNTGYIEIEFTEAEHFNYQLAAEVTDGDLLELTVTIIQEPVDVSMVHDWNLIGSNDDTGDCFQFFTTRRELPYEIEVLNVTDNAGIVQIQTVTPHGLAENQSVRVQGVLGTVEANGDWIAINVTTYTFDLALCTYVSAYLTGGTVFGNIYGLGEIGVVTKSNLGVYTYTRLLRSYELNFSTLKQIDVRVKRKQDENKAAYFTETTPIENRTYQNLPRVFYYKGAYITDGAIAPNGIYEYGSISSELAWVQSNSDFSLRFSSQTQVGGTVKSGNWRYAARLLTANFVETQFSLLTDTVPVYSYNYEAAPLVIGDVPNTVTPKINVLELTNNAVGLFKYVEIAAINYIGANGFGAYILGRYELNDQTIQYIEHTGNENNLLDLDAAELNQLSPGFTLAQNVELLDNRAILSNLTPAQTLDFSAWVETFMYSLEREGLTPIGVWPTFALQAGEYQLPINVYSKKSHMMYEQYRYGFRFKLKSGGYTQVFYPGYDIRIDLPTTLPRERVAGSFTSFDLTDDNTPPTEVYSVYINWLNINLSALIGGIPAYDLIDEIVPCRATVIPEVLGHGVAIMGVEGVAADPDGTPTAFVPMKQFFSDNSTSSPPNSIGPYPFVCGQNNLSSDIYPGTIAFGGSTNFTEVRTSAFFYCPDMSWKLNDVTFRSGDQIINFGNPERQQTASIVAFQLFYSYYAEFNGYTNITTNPTTVAITEGALMEFPDVGSITTTYFPPNVIINSNPYNLALGEDNFLGVSALPYYHDRCFACDLPSPLTDTGAYSDYGFYRAIYFRPQTDKYGDPNTTVYTEFLEPYVIGSLKGFVNAGEFNTYGDVFTQKTYLKYRYPGWFNRGSGGINDGYAACFGYYTQNRNNLQLRTKPTESYTDSAVIQQLNFISWLTFGYASPTSTAAANMLFYPLFRDSQLFYNLGYTPRNQIVSERAFNSTLEYQTDWGNALAWSSPEAEGSNTDNLRVFPPFNLKFLDYTNGAITDARAINGELVTIQPSAVIRQYFNTTAIITTEDGGEAQLGSGAPMSRRGTVMNQYGSAHKWSILIGLSERGHDVLYAIDDINKTAWRFGYDGTTTIDELHGMKSFFANYLNWIRGKFTPAHDDGIRGVTCQRFKEVIWTVRGRKEVPEWVQSTEEVRILTFDGITYGDELITNPLFVGSLYGWEQLGAPPPTTWFYSSSQSAYKPAAIGSGDYLKQVNNVAFVTGETYQIKIVIGAASGSSPNNIQIRFQIPGTLIYTLAGAGTYYFTYVAQSGDDNITIYGPASTLVSVTEVSIRQIISNSNWSGAPTWLIGSNQATADGTDGDVLMQTIADYIVVGDIYTLEFETEGRTIGDFILQIGDATSSAISANGSHTEILSPTTTGVVSFTPQNNYDGTIKGNMRLTRTTLQSYYPGDVVSIPNGSSTFEQFADIYICTVESLSYPPISPDSWELIPHTDPAYYNEYTILFAEGKNEWEMFLTPKPRIYAKFLDTYLLPRPISDTGRMYLADKGIWTSWFAQNTSVQSSVAFIDPVINKPAGRNRYLSVRIESDIAPNSMEVITTNGTNITPNSEFVQREGGEFDGYVKATNTGSISWGDAAIIRFIVATATYNKLNSFVAKVRSRARMWYK